MARLLTEPLHQAPWREVRTWTAPTGTVVMGFSTARRNLYLYRHFKNCTQKSVLYRSYLEIRACICAQKHISCSSSTVWCEWARTTAVFSSQIVLFMSIRKDCLSLSKAWKRQQTQDDNFFFRNHVCWYVLERDYERLWYIYIYMIHNMCIYYIYVWRLSPTFLACVQTMVHRVIHTIFKKERTCASCISHVHTSFGGLSISHKTQMHTMFNPHYHLVPHVTRERERERERENLLCYT